MQVLFIGSGVAFGQRGGGSTASMPKTFSAFFKKDTLKTTEGYYTVYQDGDKYYLQIPEKGLGRDVLITTQVVRGPGSLVSPASGVIRFVKGRENKLELIKPQSKEINADSLDECMTMALQKSGLPSVYKSFTIVAFGPDGKSPIVDLTADLNSPAGLFAVNSFSLLRSPDPSRSGVENCRAVEGGVVFSVTRSQTEFTTNQSMRNGGEDVVRSFVLEMVIQEIPKHDLSFKRNHLAYGFNTITKVEYDTKKYAAFTRNYIQRWAMEASPKDKKKQLKGEAVRPLSPICIYIDSVVPAPFVENVKKAVEAWNEPLRKAGWKDVFKFSQRAEDAALSYRKIVFKWAGAYNDNNSTKVINSDNGEILCARINLMDEKAKNLLNNYFLQCGQFDPRILKDNYSLDVRKDILIPQVEALIGDVLGLKANYAASTAFSPENLRSNQWLDQFGTSASVTSPLSFNYLLTASDKVTAKNLLPRISTYDYEAIAYAYGDRILPPSLKAAYYADMDKTDPYALGFLSNDPLAAVSAGMNNLKAICPKIPSILRKMNEEQNSWPQISEIASSALALQRTYLLQVSRLIGGQSKRPVIPQVNEVPVTYVSKEQQVKAFEYLQANLFDAPTPWLKNDTLLMAVKSDLKDIMLSNVQTVAGMILSVETVSSLINFETLQGNKAFTCNDLFALIDKNIFKSYDPHATPSTYQLNVQAHFIKQLLTCANSNNIILGISDESAAIHSYLIRTAGHIKHLAENHADPKTREYYQLMLMKLNQEYFNK